MMTKDEHYPRVSRRQALECIAAACLTAAGVTAFSDLAVAASGPRPADIPLDADGEMHIGPRDRCPVCAMQSQRYPKTACALQLHNGDTFYFCGTGCLIKTWLQPEVFLGVPRAEVRRAVVRDYFSGRGVDALAVTWVAGSDVMGPMGPAIVPIAEEAHVAVFTRRHGGALTFRLSEMDMALWERVLALRGKVTEKAE